MAFYELRPCDIIATHYKMHPALSQPPAGGEEEGGGSFAAPGAIILTPDTSGDILSSSLYYLESDDVFEPGSSRDLTDADGTFTTGSWNLSGSIVALLNNEITSLEKRSIFRLSQIYGENNFVRPQNYLSESIFNGLTAADDPNMILINIPQVLYGSEIKPGSVKLSFSSGDQDTNFVEDGFGGVFESGSETPIGSVFYQHGIILLGSNTSFAFSALEIGLEFSGTTTIPMTMYMCTAHRGELNFSNNESFTVFSSASNKNEITTKANQTYITTVGLYDEDYNLLGVAKTSKPILNEEGTSIQFRLKLNY